MANTPQSNSQNTRHSQKQDHRKAGQSQRQDSGGSKDTEADETVRNDRVEIGEPIPERERTIRANSTQGETGEDEDRPHDNGNTEGSRNERH